MRRLLCLQHVSITCLLQIQKGLVDMENMFELLHTYPAVDDARGQPLAITRGDVTFDNVTFRWAGALGLGLALFDLS